MHKSKHPRAFIAALTLAGVLLLVYNNCILLLVSSNAHSVKVTALLPQAAGGHPGSIVQNRDDAATIQANGATQAAVRKQHGNDSTIVEGVPEIWATGPSNGPKQQRLLKLLDAGTVTQLKSLCGRCLYRTLASYVRAHEFGRVTVVLTGDIPAMWIRDSAVQMASYFPRIRTRPAIRQMLEGAVRAQSYFILQV